jgi:tetratricopeptide (TPR) repeat protein
MGFVPGAIVGTYVSSDARTFQEPPPGWEPKGNWNDQTTWFGGSPQSLIGDLIREGATGAAGHVAEPYLASTIRPQILFPAYLAGFTLADAYYLAMPHLSWQTVVIGDPLCRPFRGKTLTRGDIEAPVDPATELPGHFSRRRLQVARQALGEANVPAATFALHAEVLAARNDVNGARGALEKATELSPSLAALQLQLALLYEQLGQRDEAFDRYRRVLTLQPNNVLALNNLAFGLAVYKKAPAEALPLARRAAALSPTEPNILDTHAWVEHLLGNDEVAAKLLTAAVARGSSSPDIHFHAATVFAARNAWAAAAHELDEAIRLDPAFEKRAEVRQLRERIDAAREVRRQPLSNAFPTTKQRDTRREKNHDTRLGLSAPVV